MKILLAIGLGVLAWQAIDTRIRFDVVIVNTGAVDVDEASIEFTKFRHTFGILDARANGTATATYSSAYTSWPKTLSIFWVDIAPPSKAYRQVLVVPPPMKNDTGSPLELLVEIRDGKACAYPRIYFQTSSSTYRHQKDPPCDFSKLPMAEVAPMPKSK